MRDTMNLGQTVGVQVVRKESTKQEDVASLISEVIVDVEYNQGSIPDESFNEVRPDPS